ncbi:hypothetical protein [Paenibacillus sp. OV219]|uniref:hypothetical protein n=1 Tax=Paenibacillus sp. OV219 TaxID=1884377 RepID=UPI0008C04294|nr:hypothetical protein [Paenibacillus sp. OV219]SEP15810.1 hypothetical protein SAMN05518847_12121 [Paenibacillus sp. OV219]
MKKLAATFILSVVLLAACGKTNPSSQSDSMGNMAGMNHNNNHMSMTPVADTSQEENVQAMFLLSHDVRGQEHICIKSRVLRGFLYYGYNFLSFPKDMKLYCFPIKDTKMKPSPQLLNYTC